MTDKDLKKIIRDNFTSAEQSKIFETERFHNFVSNLPDKSKPRYQFRLRYAFLAFLIFVLTLGIIALIGPENRVENPSLENPVENIEDYFNPEKLELNYLIYSGVTKSFEAASFQELRNNNGPILKKLSQETETDEDENIFHHPFEYLRINNPLSFYVNIEPGTNELIEKHCGSGEIEVIICKVFFHVEGGFVQEESLIIFKGVYGIYSCLTNGGSDFYDENSNIIKSIYEFSSHKYISGNEVIKDLRLKNVIRVIVDQGVPLSLEFEDLYTSEIYNSYEPYSPKSINCSDLYSVKELFTFGIVFFETRITGIEADFIKVAAVEGLNLVNGQFDHYSEINRENLEVGQYVKITYLKYYEEYNPITTYLYKINVLDNIDHKVYWELREDDYQIISIPTFTELKNELSNLNQMIDLIKIVDFYCAQKEGELLLVFVIDTSEVGEGLLYEVLNPEGIVDYAFSYFGYEYSYADRSGTNEYENTLIFIFSENSE